MVAGADDGSAGNSAESAVDEIVFISGATLGDSGTDFTTVLITLLKGT